MEESHHICKRMEIEAENLPLQMQSLSSGFWINIHYRYIHRPHNFCWVRAHFFREQVPPPLKVGYRCVFVSIEYPAMGPEVGRKWVLGCKSGWTRFKPTFYSLWAHFAALRNPHLEPLWTVKIVLWKGPWGCPELKVNSFCHHVSSSPLMKATTVLSPLVQEIQQCTSKDLWLLWFEKILLALLVAPAFGEFAAGWGFGFGLGLASSAFEGGSGLSSARAAAKILSRIGGAGRSGSWSSAFRSGDTRGSEVHTVEPELRMLCPGVAVWAHFWARQRDQEQACHPLLQVHLLHCFHWNRVCRVLTRPSRASGAHCRLQAAKAPLLVFSPDVAKKSFCPRHSHPQHYMWGRPCKISRRLFAQPGPNKWPSHWHWCCPPMIGATGCFARPRQSGVSWWTIRREKRPDDQTRPWNSQECLTWQARRRKGLVRLPACRPVCQVWWWTWHKQHQLQHREEAMKNVLHQAHTLQPRKTMDISIGHPQTTFISNPFRPGWTCCPQLWWRLPLLEAPVFQSAFWKMVCQRLPHR